MGTYFPLFINMEGKKVQVFGGGKIAARRVSVLLEFGVKVRVTAPEISEQLIQMAEREDSLTLEFRGYQKGEIQDADLVLAAASDENVNHMIFQECRHKEIPVNVASDQSKCDFYFPGLAVKEKLVAGVTAGGEDHKLARRVTEEIRALMEKL